MISGLHHYALEVPDLEIADGFLTDFGLETAQAGGALIAQCPGSGQEQVRMMQGAAKRLHHVAFTLAPGSQDDVLASLERAGTPLIEPPAGAEESGTWLRDPDGTAVQLLAAGQAPPRAVPEILVNSGAWGSWIEWFSDIDQIDDCWVAGDWDVPPQLWGAPPPDTFLANCEQPREAQGEPMTRP